MLVRLKNGIDEAIQAEQIDDDGEGCVLMYDNQSALKKP